MRPRGGILGGLDVVLAWQAARRLKLPGETGAAATPSRPGVLAAADAYQSMRAQAAPAGRSRAAHIRQDRRFQPATAAMFAVRRGLLPEKTTIITAAL